MPSQKSVSLHCTKGTSDKVYNMQMVLTDPAGGRWSVYAQNGRRGSSLTPRTKCENVSYGEADTTYQDVLNEKLGKGYRTIPLNGKSILPPAPAVKTAPKIKLPPLPAWPDLDTGYAEAATLLGEPMTLTTDPRPHLVLLVDIAAGAQEGFSEAVALLKKCKTAADVSKLLSKDGRAWFGKLPQPAAQDAAQALSSACQALR